MQYINLNGRLFPADQAVWSQAQALLFSYGLFETMYFNNGTIRLENYHWDRLFEGLETIDFDLPATFTREYLQQQVLATAAQNDIHFPVRIRLQISPVEKIMPGILPKPFFIVECLSLPEKTGSERLITGLAKGITKSMDQFSGLKSNNTFIYTQAAIQAGKNGWDDALICNTDNNIIESTIANIFWVKSGAVFTPPLTDGCVAGVMRRHMKTLIIQHHIPFAEQSLSRETLLSADEVFLTNAIRGIRPVVRFEDHDYTSVFTEDLMSLIHI